MRNIAIFILFATCLAQGNAQNCYQCFSLSTDITGSERQLDVPGQLACSADGTGEVVDCSLAGGCQKSEFNLQYSSTEYNDFKVTMSVRACGANQNTCLGNDEISTVLNQQRGNINAAIEAVYPDAGIQFVDGGGDVCLCNSNLCNDATGMMAPTITVLILALAAALIVRFA